MLIHLQTSSIRKLGQKTNMFNTWISKIKAIQGRIVSAKEVVQKVGKNGLKLTKRTGTK